MHINEYQEEAKKTAAYPRDFGAGWVYPALGLAGEAGEVADKIKKIIRDNKGVMTPEFAQSIAQELGDVLWYIAILSNELGFDLEQVAEINIKKLADRQQRGVIGGSGDNR